MKSVIEIFDPAMCCSTGVCGSEIDETLADFANDLKWLKSKGIEVKRFNLGQEPEAFKGNPLVLNRLQSEGSDILPIIIVNNTVTSEAHYPDRKQLCEWLGISVAAEANGQPTAPHPDVLNELTQAVTNGDVVAMSVTFHKAKEAGTELQQVVNAIQAGIDKRQKVTGELVQTANALFGVVGNSCAPGGGCC
jgi:hypothetical protein